jgi:transposase
MARPAASIELTPEERSALEGWARRHRTHQALSLRARIILLASKGMDGCDIANELSTTMQTVSKWRVRFSKDRLEGLSDAPRSGQPRKISDDDVQRVIDRTLHTKPDNATHWSTRSMAKAVGLTQNAILRIWQTFGLQPHREETFKISTDPHFVEKVRDVVGLYMNPPEHALVLCVDEKSQIQALDRTQPMLPLGPGRPERRTHDYFRHGTVSLFAALDVATGKVTGILKQRHRAKEFLDFLNHLDKTIERKEGQEIHLVLDNYGTHKTQEVRRWFQRRPYYHLHFTPTSASWLNLVERFFSEITTKRIRRGSFRSVKALRDAVLAYLDGHNEKPRPFKWTAPADLILRRVGNVIKRINQSGH